MFMPGVAGKDCFASGKQAMAIAIGFRDVADLRDEGYRIADDLLAGRSSTMSDWRPALLATEVAFAK
jgi:hypothetical protein